MHEPRALTDFHVRFVFVCPEARSRLRLNARAFTFMHLADAFIQTYIAFKLQYLHFISSCFPWESNP